MKKTTFLLLAILVSTIVGCKREKPMQTKNDEISELILAHLSENLSKELFSDIDKTTISYLSDSPNKGNALVYFNKNGENRNKVISIKFEQGKFATNLLDVKINIDKEFYTIQLDRTNIETKKFSSTTSSVKPNPTQGVLIESDVSNENDPQQLQEIIVVGRINGQSSFIIQAFVRGMIDALNYSQLYFNSQNQSVVHPSEFDHYGIPGGGPEIVELQFASPEEAAAFQQWLNQVSPAELALCLENPVAALQIYRHSKTALSAFPHWNGLGDAKRHAYWMALCAADPLVGSTFAGRFGIAHETGGMPSSLQGTPFGHRQWQLEKQSDLHNNNEGIRIIALMRAAGVDIFDFNILFWLNSYSTPGGALMYLCDPTPNSPGSGDEVLRFSNQACP